LQPLSFDEHFEAIDGTIIWIEHQFGQGDHLRSSIPAVGAVHQNWPLMNADIVNNKTVNTKKKIFI